MGCGNERRFSATVPVTYEAQWYEFTGEATLATFFEGVPAINEAVVPVRGFAKGCIVEFVGIAA
jgi:hypothetical protein